MIDFLKNATLRDGHKWIIRVISFPKRYTFTNITHTFNKLWHKTLFFNWRNCEGGVIVRLHLLY